MYELIISGFLSNELFVFPLIVAMYVATVQYEYFTQIQID